MALSVVPVANLTAGQFILGILDPVVRDVNYVSVPYTSAAAGGAGVPTVQGAMVGFPTVAATPVVTAAPDGTNNVGIVAVTLAPNAADVVNSSSPLVIKASPEALAIVASTATG